MIACLRPISALCLAGLLSACANQPSSTLGELPRTPQATIEQLLQQAADSPNEQAAPLRLSAADLAYTQKNFSRASKILEQVQLENLKPAQQIYASTLRAELDMRNDNPKAALRALSHPSMERLGELPIEQQVRSQLVRAEALQANGQTLAAARERAFIAPLLNGASATQNHEAIWSLVSSLPLNELQASGDADLDGWLELARASKSASTLEQQQAAIEDWIAKNPQHPAAQQLPQALVELKKISSEPQHEISLLLPME
jgi:outer membrane PBP1 activator LpoA protein